MAGIGEQERKVALAALALVCNGLALLLSSVVYGPSTCFVETGDDACEIDEDDMPAGPPYLPFQPPNLAAINSAITFRNQCSSSSTF